MMDRYFKKIIALNWWRQRLRMTYKVWFGGNVILVHNIEEYESEKGAARSIELTGQTEYSVESDALSLMAASYMLVPPENYVNSTHSGTVVPPALPPFGLN